MAVRLKEIELLREGCQAATPSKGSFALNLLNQSGTWKTREGFGQLAQFDTTLSHNPSGATTEWGYRRHLGSHLIHTNFGHDQIVSVFKVRSNTGGQDYVTQVLDLYAVSIYDVTTGNRWEEIVHRHTSENSTDLVKLYEQHGCYETDLTNDYQGWVSGSSEDEFYFTEHQDILYLGNRATGLLAYLPASFRATRHRFVNSIDYREWSNSHYSESSLVVRAIPVDGIFADDNAYAYLTTTTLPAPTDVCVMMGRMVYASGRTIYFSDVGYPTSVIATNFINVFSEQEIVAVEEQLGSLVIFTPNEVWHYQPSVGDLVSQGRLTKISDTIGATSKNAITRAEGSLIWASSVGLHATSGSLTVETISKGIEAFWRDPRGLAVPLTSYYAASGWTTLDSEDGEPRTWFRFAPEGCNATYSPKLRSVFLTFPSLNASIVFNIESSLWSLWSYETQVFEQLTAVSGRGLIDQPYTGAQRNIETPWLLTNQTDLYLIGTEDQELEDLAQGLVAPNDDTTSSSYYILEYGRGGSLDRSVADEDYRTITGKYKRTGTATVADSQSGLLYLEKWIPVATGYEFPGGHVVDESSPVFLVPFEYMMPTSFPDGIDHFDIILAFDNSQWRPVYRTSAYAAEIDLLIPSERLASAGGYSLGAPIAGTSEARCYTAGTGTVSTSGDSVRIRWDGASSSSSWSYQPYMNLNPLRRNRLFYLPMQYTGTGTAELSGMVWALSVDTKFFDTARSATGTRPDMIKWEQWTKGACRRQDDNVAQPIDWAYQSDQVGPGTGSLYKARGVSIRLMSHGKAVTRLGSSWPFGVLNTIVGADWKQWISQQIDYTDALSDHSALEAIENKTDVRTGILPVGGDALVTRTFQRSGQSDLTWGDTTDSSVGNVLVADDQVNVVETSDSVKGNEFSYMVFGHLSNRAEHIELEEIVASYLPMQGKHRTGR